MPIGRIGPELIVDTTTADNQVVPAITTLADGRFLVTWQSYDTGDGDGYCIRARIYNANGSPSGNDFIVNTTTASYQYAPTATTLSDGRYVVTWYSGDSGDGYWGCVRARIYLADGTSTGNDFVVNTTIELSQYNPQIAALPGGRFFATWYSEDFGDGNQTCIRGRFYNADGTASGNDFLVNTTRLGRQTDPSVATLSDGRMVVAWDSTGDGSADGDGAIRARIYKVDGTPAGPDFLVNTTTNGQQIIPSVTTLSNGGFVIVWQSLDGGDGDGYTIRGRTYNPDGTSLLNDFVVGSSGLGQQVQTWVEALADGRFVVAWKTTDVNVDGSGSAVVARLYNAIGAPIGNDFLVNSAGVGDQIEPAIAALADGRFVVTWQSADPGEGSGTSIRAQMFDPTVFTGTAGPDTWQGGNLADRIDGGGGADILSGLDGNDAIRGNDGNDTLDGGEGDDTLDGGPGADTMYGGGGNDVFFVDNAGDFALESSGRGNDRVFASVSWTLSAGSEVEVISTDFHAGTAPINLSGNELAQVIFGNAGNNILDGRGGADTLVGFGGNDWYLVDNAGDTVVEAVGGGADRVFASVSWTLGAGSEVETISTDFNAGTAAINLSGNEIANVMFGNAGDNVLDGRGGADTMVGFGGNDSYLVDNLNDAVIEAAGAGTDRVYASVSWNMGVGQAIEMLTTDFNAGTTAINLRGNEFDNVIIGNAGTNILVGRDGNDTLWGFGGTNFFLFETAPNSTTNVDTIGDYNVANDQIVLIGAVFPGLPAGTLAAAAFTFGTGAHEADDRIIYDPGTGNLFFDPDGLGGAAQVRFAVVSAGLGMNENEFRVI